MNKRIFKTALLLALALTLAFSTVAFAADPTYSEDWDGTRGLDSEKCEYAGQPGRPATGWIHWVFATKGESQDALLTLGGTGSGSYGPGEPLTANIWHFYTPFFTLDGLTARIDLFGGGAGSGGGLVISDYCPGAREQLEVSKTVNTSYSREHSWGITKSVDVTDIYLFIPGQDNKPSSGTATWTVAVSYGGFVDYDHKVFGDIQIKNTGLIDAVVTSVDDVLAGASIDVTCPVSFPYTLPAGASLICTYSEDVTDKIGGNNVVTVTTEKDTYTDTEPITWGGPAKEFYKTVTISDISDLFGTQTLGTVTAPNGATFQYSKTFNWADYGADKCGSYTYNNTATIVETGQSASASLSVHVQCYKYETAYARGSAATCFIPTFSNWGWTNSLSARETVEVMDLWAAAAQCDTSKGAKVGTVTVTYGLTGFVNASYNVAAPYIIKETHFYAGKTMFPIVNKRTTVAPGLYTNTGPFSGQIWTIAHAVVGLPDPTFGPK